MCGIVGCLDWGGREPPDEGLLRRMLTVIRHRGPDEFGLFLDQQVGLGSARLSIIDLETGQQPMANEDGSLWIVMNGEVFNYLELREGLVQRGHRFATLSDTEVVLHLYEERRAACLEELNGQFAIAIWDAARQELFLARDRVGICPLFYAPLAHGLLFASEIKAILLDPRLPARLDPYGLNQAYTFWAPLAPRTVFQGVEELQPGHWMRIRDGQRTLGRYWRLEFPHAGEEERLPEAQAAAQLHDLLADATRLRLRADVPVGSYLSGGLDSTYVAGLIRQRKPVALTTFSIAFEDPAYDESAYQELATAFLDTDHHRAQCRTASIGEVFPQVIWHAEAPVLRTSPAPMFLLSQLVHEHGLKVVLTGEGADEFLGGYNIYKEDKIRRFWARQPDSTIRPLLLRRLYPYVADLSRSGDAYLAAYFGRGLTETSRPGYSHRLRWLNTARLRGFLAKAYQLPGYDPVEEPIAGLDGALSPLSPLAQAQFLEVTTFMSPYLLASQGDRVLAAHSVEGRFPFLDHRVIEFAARLQPRLKIRGLCEKYLLKESADELLPTAIVQRRKQPYRAPIHRAFLEQPPAYVGELLSPEALDAAGVLAPEPVSRLLAKHQRTGHLSEFEDMALVGALSTQLVHQQFIQERPQMVPEAEPVRVWRREEREP